MIWLLVVSATLAVAHRCQHRLFARPGSPSLPVTTGHSNLSEGAAEMQVDVEEARPASIPEVEASFRRPIFFERTSIIPTDESCLEDWAADVAFPFTTAINITHHIELSCISSLT